MGSLEAALFAIVYRYAIRGDENPMLNQGVVGAFVFVRTLSRVQVPRYCSAAPLSCKFCLFCGSCVGCFCFFKRGGTFFFVDCFLFCCCCVYCSR